MQTVAQLPEVDVVTNNTSLQQEVDLSQKIFSVLESSIHLEGHVEKWKKLTEKKQRMIVELEEFRKNKQEIETALEDLKRDFGNEDSLSDLEKIEKQEIRLKVLNETIPLLERKLDPSSSFSRDIRYSHEDVYNCVEHELFSVHQELQREVNEKINNIVDTTLMNRRSIGRATAEQKIMPAELWGGSMILSKVLPNLEKVSDLLKLDSSAAQPFFLAGTKYEGGGAGENNPAQVTTEPQQIFPKGMGRNNPVLKRF